MTTPKQSSSEGQSEEHRLTEGLRKQIEHHLETMKFGELTLIVEKGFIRFIRRVESERASS